MIYRIADFNIDIQNISTGCAFCFRDYLAADETKVDFSISICGADIDYELAESLKASPDAKFTRTTCETLAVQRKICAEILARDGFMMHGVAVEYEGKGYIFTAKSGTGKTTHVLLWKKLFGDDKVRIINGDKPFLRFIDDKIYAYGTPWCGKEQYNINDKMELGAICFVERGEKNSIAPLTDEIEKMQRIIPQIMVADSTNLAKQLELLDMLFDKIKIYKLFCNMDTEAAKVAYEGMKF